MGDAELRSSGREMGNESTAVVSHLSSLNAHRVRLQKGTAMRHTILSGVRVLPSLLLLVGCGQAPSRPPRPVNPLYQAGPVHEGKVDVAADSLARWSQQGLEKIGWKALTTDTGPKDGAIEAQGKKGERVEIRYERDGEKTTLVSIRGTSTTPQKAVDGLYDKIHSLHL